MLHLKDKTTGKKHFSHHAITAHLCNSQQTSNPTAAPLSPSNEITIGPRFRQGTAAHLEKRWRDAKRFRADINSA
jgi:hypothetical protein